jgi:hypothetical protein
MSCDREYAAPEWEGRGGGMVCETFAYWTPTYNLQQT